MERQTYLFFFSCGRQTCLLLFIHQAFIEQLLNTKDQAGKCEGYKEERHWFFPQRASFY